MYIHIYIYIYVGCTYKFTNSNFKHNLKFKRNNNFEFHPIWQSTV